MEAHPKLEREAELAYSGQFSLSQADAHKIRSMCLEFVEGLRKRINESPCEIGYAFNLDWFKI